MQRGPPQLRLLLEGMGLLLDAGDALIEHARTHFKDPPVSRGATIRPGFGSPFWNQLALLTESQLTRYGSKANLGRMLGVPRQMIHQYFVIKTAMPDAERTLVLLFWLISLERNGTIVPIPDIPPRKYSKRRVLGPRRSR